MRLRSRTDRKNRGRREQLFRAKPAIESFEPRLLLATGFVQGFAVDNSNAPIPGATITLINPGNNTVVATATTNADGYYGFNGVAPGTYDVSETAPGYAPVLNSSDIQTTINPASLIAGNSEFQVTVLDLSQVTESIGVTWTSGFSGDYVVEALNASSYNVAGAADNENGQYEGSLALALKSNQGDITHVGSFCTDLMQGVDQNSPYTTQPSLTPNTTTLTSLPSYATNLGELGYLYNTYGRTAPVGQTFTSTTNAGLQLAIWALEYNQMPATGPMTLANPDSPFVVSMSASNPIVVAANADLAAAYGKSEDAYFLNLNTPTENINGANNGQGMVSTDLLTFSNILQPKVTPAITTSANPTGEMVGGSSLTDTADLTGGNNPTGTITFTLTSPSNTVVDTESVAVSGNGNYTTPIGSVPTQVGTYYWLASYSGDTNNVAVNSGATSEPVIISQASPAITTQATVSAGGVVGTALLADVATLSGGDGPTGTISFTLTAPDGTTAPEGSVVATGDGVYGSPTSVLATEVGTYSWHAIYSGDTLNAGASDNGANEGVTTIKASPAITTQATVSAGGVVGTALLADVATLSGGDGPTGTISFSLTAPDGTTAPEGSVAATGDGVYGSPISVLATEVGTYSWHAIYSGDTLNAGASDNGANEGVTTIKASPAITTQATVSAGGVVGTALLADVATLSGGDGPTGTISFTLTAPDGTTAPEGSVAANGDGVYGSPTSVLATEVGTYSWHAIYSGDTLNAGASDNGANEGVTTIKASPAITTQATVSAGGVVGTALLADVATLSGGDGPTGTITFTLTAPDGTTAPEGSVVANGDGVYGSPTSVLATEVGTYSWHAVYSGDTLNAGASDNGANEGVTTIKASPAITTQATVSAGGVVGTALLADVATLSGGDGPTGTITFTLTAPDGTTAPEGSVVATGDGVYGSPTSVLATEVGTYSWHAIYSGDTLNAGASDNGANEGVTTIKASPAITTQATVSAGGVVGTALLADVATLSGGDGPTGTISFTLTAPDGTTAPEGSVVATGDGVYGSPTSVLATEVGTYSWNAVYSGDTLNAGASDNGANEGVTTIKASPAITTQATVSAGGVVGTALLADVATLSGGDGPTGTISFTLTAPDGTTAPEGSVAATGDGVYGSPTSVLATEVGTYSWHAVYSGDTLNAGASDNGANEGVTTIKASPAITTQATVSAGGVVETALLADVATLSGGDGPTGTISFSLTAPDGTTASEGSVAATGDGVYGSPTSVLATEVGTYSWHAVYSGNTLNAGASDNGANEGVTTIKASPAITTQATVSAGGVVGTALLADVATLSGGDGPTGTITFTLTAPDGTTAPEGSVVATGDGVYGSPTSVLATEVGTYSWHAVYSGNTLNAGASDNGANEGVTTIKASPAITTQATVSAGGVVGTALLADVATLSGGDGPTGTITFTLTAPDGTTASEGSVAVTGDGVYGSPTSVLATEVGTYSWHAVYSGNTLNAGASDNGANEGVTTIKATPAITTQATGTAGDVVGTSLLSDSAVLSGGYAVSGGTITFTLTAPSGGTTTESVGVTGAGTYVTPTAVLATQVGTYTWHASYSGAGVDNAAVDQGGAAEKTTVVMASPTITTVPGGSPTIGFSTISGVKYLDATGNGFSSDDSPQSGVVVDLYAESNTQPGLQEGTGGDSLVATTTTGSNGSYSFTVTTAGVYYVQEVVPSGYVQTGGGQGGTAGDTYFTVNASSGQSYSGYNFDDYLVPTCTPTNVCFKVTTPSGHTTTVTNLAGATQQGDTVTATFTVPSGMNDQLTLVSYLAPGSSFSDSTAYEQQIYQQATGTFSPGTHSLTVTIPSSDYQIDFVCGQSINELEPNQNGDAYGPDSAEILYHAENRIISWDNGGTTAGSLTNPTPTSPPTLAASPIITPALTDSATLSGGDNPTGTITFYLFAPGVTANSNDSNSIYSTAVTVKGVGTVTTAAGTNPGGYVPTVPGTYEWVAVYSGDANNKAVQGSFGAEPEIVAGKLSPTIATTPNVTTDICGTTKLLTDTATLAGSTNATGTITFTLYGPSGGSPLDTEMVTMTSGVVTYTTPTGYSLPATAAAGVYQWDASYSGDTNNNPASDNNDVLERVVVNPASPAITTTPSITNVTLSKSSVTLNDTAVLSGGSSETGTITFTLYLGSTLEDTETINVSGNGSFTTPTGYTLPSSGVVAGLYQWDASYSGDSRNIAVSENNASAEQVMVNKGSSNIATVIYNACTKTPISGNQATNTSVYDTASVGGTLYKPTGTVTYYFYNTATPVFGTTSPLGSQTVTLSNGTVPNSCSTGALPAGSYSVIGVYSGDGNYAGVTGAVELLTVVGCQVSKGSTAATSYWHNKNGQGLIDSFNGGANSTALGNWLASSFSNLFGGFAGQTNAQIAADYLAVSNNVGGVQGNLYAQAFATALAVYATDPTLGGGSASSAQGFTVVIGGTGSETFNVGANGAAFGVANNTTLTVFQILQILNSNCSASTGLFYAGSQSPTTSADNVFSAINQAGSIS